MPHRLLRRSRRTWLSLTLWRHRLLFWSGAVAVGVAAVVFARASDRAIAAFHGVTGNAPWATLIITPATLALIVWLARRYFPGSQGSGIPQTIAALHTHDQALRRRLLSLRVAFGKMVMTVAALAAGASVGREGPTVQIGAAIMHALSRLTSMPRQELERSLILAGSAAGVAAAFNTPLAGVVFAIEEMSRSFEQRWSGNVLTAVIIAGIVSLAWLGNYTYFGHTPASLASADDWTAVLICGVVGGFLGGLFARLVIASAHGLPGAPGRLMRERPVAFAAACGLALAVIGLISGNSTYGTGYQEARAIVEGTAELPVFYGLLKLLATLVSFVSGIPGGVFAPSLSIGAGIGANLAALMPYAPAGAVVILGMVAYFAGVVQAPITAFVIVMEMTDNHDMVVPLMATALVANGASRLICRHRLYGTLAEGFLKRDRRGDSITVRPPPPPTNP